MKKSGQIIPEETIRANFAKKVHKDQVKDLLAREIIYKTLDIERTRQVAIKNELERTAKKELVQRVRVSVVVNDGKCCRCGCLNVVAVAV